MNRGLRKELSFLAGTTALGLLLSRNNFLAALFGIGAAWLRFMPSPTYTFQGRNVIITGGSRGLGLALAECLLKEGASVTLLARDMDELEHAEILLAEKSPVHKILGIRCDVTHPEELRQAIDLAEKTFGRIDVLINNAGTISVGPFETMEQADFEALINVQVYAVVNAVQRVLPVFKRQGEGRIVNISSIGGELPVPHMSTYCAGKFALTGLSETLNAELAPLNIKVTTVYPGMMRTGSPIQAVFKGNHEKEYAWFSTGDVMPGISVSALSAARKILDGLRHGDAQVSYPVITKVGIMGHAVFPELYALVMRQAARSFFPKGDSRTRKTGADSQGWLERQFWYKPFQWVEERAERQFNQTEKHNANFNLGVRSGV